jgi:N6-L-threonylcarbamoyladenine synthase
MERAMARRPTSKFNDLDGVAAAAGPGLIGGVLVGLTTGRRPSRWCTNKPLIAVNHLEAHALTARLTDNMSFPYCLLLASGGHTQIVAVLGVGEYQPPRLDASTTPSARLSTRSPKCSACPIPAARQVENARGLNGDPARFAFPRPMLGAAEAEFLAFRAEDRRAQSKRTRLRR